MEFLVISQPREAFLASSPQSVMRQIVEAQCDVVRQHKEAGKIVKINYIPGWSRRMTIYRCDSPEELDKLLHEIPAEGLCFSNEVYALSDHDESMKTILINMARGDDIMPGGTVK